MGVNEQTDHLCLFLAAVRVDCVSECRFMDGLLDKHSHTDLLW